MLEIFIEEAATLASITLFIGTVAIWAQLIPQFPSSTSGIDASKLRLSQTGPAIQRDGDGHRKSGSMITLYQKGHSDGSDLDHNAQK